MEEIDIWRTATLLIRMRWRVFEHGTTRRRALGTGGRIGVFELVPPETTPVPQRKMTLAV